MNGEKNPRFEETLVFENDFPALLGPELRATDTTDADTTTDADATTTTTTTTTPSSNLFQTSPTFGSCKVITYSPRHDLTLALMETREIMAVIRCWTDVYVAEGEVIRAGHKNKAGGMEGDDDDEGCVNIFENRGSMMGASAPHPHGQVWSTSL
jgi:UDPglucose--hexose-1-phosphate uridylyltransferase